MEPLILAIGWIITFIVLALSLKILNKRIEDKHIPLMAVLAAGIFVAQMLNFPIGVGTSGHLVGAALVAILLGPYAGVVVITTILVIQCMKESGYDVNLPLSADEALSEMKKKFVR